MSLKTTTGERPEACRRQRGFSLLEMLASIAVLLIVAGVVMSAMLQMMKTQGTIANRTEMHSSVRSATELLTQEIGQAGRVSLPGPVTLTSPVAATGLNVVTVSSAAGIFNGEQLVVDAGANQETVQVTSVSPLTNTITGTFVSTHASNVPVTVQGAFPTGIVPPNMANGSTGAVLKLYGDINGDGSMQYVEYTCDLSTNPGKLYRNITAFDTPSVVKPPRNDSMVLLNNILGNPDGTPCFAYQTTTAGADTYVVNVAVTLTVQTQDRDPQTRQFQTETKALLNVSPRNVFNAWELAGGNALTRLQPMPPSVAQLIATTP